MAEIKFSQLTTAAQLTNDDIFALAQMQGGSLSSVKTSMIAVANFLNTQVQYTTAYNTQAKTTAGAINELKQLISLIPQFSIEVVDELPTEDISDTTIYLVPAEDPEVGNYYEEYIHVNNTWELVGTTAVDLSAYYTKLEVDGLLATKASVTEVALKENKSDMPTDVRTIIKDCKTPKNATITNGIAQFECIEENLVKGLKVTMNPIQDLHGYSNPWVGGAGKNKLPFDIAEIISNNQGGTWSGNIYTYRGITFTPDSEGKWKATGTATEASFIRVGKFKPSNGSYLINGITGGSGTTYRIRYRVGDNPSQNMYNGDSNTITVDGDTEILFDLYVSANYTADITFEPMIRLSSVADSTFAPYSNICPISGRTEASVTRTGKNLFDKTTAQVVGGYFASNTFTQNSNHSTVYIPIYGGFTYTISKALTSRFSVAVSDVVPTNGAQYINAELNNTATHLTINANANGKYLWIWCRFVTLDTLTIEQIMDTIQVELGSTATAYEPYTAETKTHQYSETIYGGVDDFGNGGATSTMGMVDMGDLNWTYDGTRFASPITDKIQSSNRLCGLSSQYPLSDTNVSGAPDHSIIMGINADLRVFVKDSNYTDATVFKTAMDGVQLCYELATPTTISTSAEEITTVSGTNIISGTEPISECKYTELATVDDLRKIIGGQQG